MRTKSDHWQKTIQAHIKSGLSAAAFCRQRKINIYQFRWWQRRFRKDETKSLKTKPGDFLRLMPDSEPQRDRKSGIQLYFPNGIRVEIEPGFDPAALRNVMAAIQVDQANPL
ncbi:MAG: hypothetical protein EHM45_21595 [Desulfobacteraceae bacterium]|nr:MAG: hypothetical protein EHM45_21595 [Desulfobacteraceae bacterium]